MAYFCPVCESIYDHQRTNCPTCGGRVLSDARPDEVLEQAGYVHAPVLSWTSNPRIAVPSNASGGTTDPFFSQLWQDYQREHTPTEPRSQFQDPIPAPGPSTTVESERPPRIPEADFFSQFEGEPSQEPIPEELPRDPEAERLDRDLRDHAAAVQATGRQARRARTGFRRAFRGRAMPPVASGRLLRILPVLCVIGFLIFLWQMRFAIAAAIWHVISALMPSILTVAAIIWLLRSIFRH